MPAIRGVAGFTAWDVQLTIDKPFEPDPVNTGVGMGNWLRHAKTGSQINIFI